MNLVNTAIGVNQHAARHVIERQARELTALKQDLAKSNSANAKLEDRLAAIEKALQINPK
jgi:hypothetical protein